MVRRTLLALVGVLLVGTPAVAGTTVTCWFPQDGDKHPHYDSVSFPNVHNLKVSAPGVLRFTDASGTFHIVVDVACEVTTN